MARASDHITTSLDLSGLKCPLPVLKARRAIKNMHPDDVLEVIATDPAAQLDFPHFCDVSGHELISITQEGMQDSERDQTILKILIKVSG